jgi:NADPH-dependent curcumin reductase
MRCLTWTGFVIFDHVGRFGAAIDQLTDMLVAGTLAHDETVMPGLPHVIEAFERLFTGTNSGKTLVYIGED